MDGFDRPERAGRGSVSLAAKHAMLLAVGLRYRRLYSSLLRAIEAGKPPAIDYLNGEIVKGGELVDVPTPINRAVCELVWAMSRASAKRDRTLGHRSVIEGLGADCVGPSQFVNFCLAEAELEKCAAGILPRRWGRRWMGSWAPLWRGAGAP